MADADTACDYCRGVGACPRCWGRSAIAELTAKLDAARAPAVSRASDPRPAPPSGTTREAAQDALSKVLRWHERQTGEYGLPAGLLADVRAASLPETGTGSTAWRCKCGAWNHAACRSCGAGPDERWASKAELDALVRSPSPAPADPGVLP